MLQKPNVLVLDEPSNHLDLEAINALNLALQKYEGTVLLVTHDLDLIEEVATRIWHFEGGPADFRIEDFKGPYAEYRCSWRRSKLLGIRGSSNSFAITISILRSNAGEQHRSQCSPALSASLYESDDSTGLRRATVLGSRPSTCTLCIRRPCPLVRKTSGDQPEKCD